MNADDFVGGHSILALERFMDETRHMIIFDVLSWKSPVGEKGERLRLFLSDVGYHSITRLPPCRSELIGMIAGEVSDNAVGIVQIKHLKDWVGSLAVSRSTISSFTRINVWIWRFRNASVFSGTTPSPVRNWIPTDGFLPEIFRPSWEESSATVR